MSLSVSVIIPNYESWSDAVRCARAAAEYSGKKLNQILIVDDGSSSSGPNELPNPVRVVRNEVNRGVIETENIGFSCTNADIVVILDSDAEPLMDFVPGVVQAFEKNPELGALGFHTVDRKGNATGIASPEPTVLDLVLGQRGSGWIRYLGRKVGAVRTESTEQICLHSCATAFRRTAYEEIGGFDEGFDFLEYDIDFSIRLRNAGWKVMKASDIEAYHEGGGSPQSYVKRLMRHHQNRWRLLRKHEKIQYPSLVKYALALRHVLEYGMFYVAGPFLTDSVEERNDKLRGRRDLLRGVWDGYSA
jgi:GT2 family glycosyltransferase